MSRRLAPPRQAVSSKLWFFIQPFLSAKHPGTNLSGVSVTCLFDANGDEVLTGRFPVDVFGQPDDMEFRKTGFVIFHTPLSFKICDYQFANGRRLDL
jgi:hypothetical protein